MFMTYHFVCSALDAESERVVQDALDKVTKGENCFNSYDISISYSRLDRNVILKPTKVISS